jgi:hypothetical protein
MALRVAHILALFAESGVILSVHETHMNRDRAYDQAKLLWKLTCGRRGQPAPAERLDVLVPIELSDAQVMLGVENMLRRKAAMDEIVDMAVDMLLNQITR